MTAAEHTAAALLGIAAACGGIGAVIGLIVGVALNEYYGSNDDEDDAGGTAADDADSDEPDEPETGAHGEPMGFALACTKQQEEKANAEAE